MISNSGCMDALFVFVCAPLPTGRNGLNQDRTAKYPPDPAYKNFLNTQAIAQHLSTVSVNNVVRNPL